MHQLAIPFTFLEIAIFSVAVIAFILAVRFFIASLRNLQHLLPSKKKKHGFGVSIDRDGFIVPGVKQGRPQPEATVYENTEETKQEIKELRDMMQLQQLELTRAMRQIEQINSKRTEEHYYEAYDEEEEKEASLPSNSETSLLAEELRQQLERKEAEIRELRQQTELNQPF
ncbi:MAG: hypothetical protein EON98_06790 [Chitinophagaceae bacterium]|nr:MAG: hypothetical protein EON98_06790 [Chitinophagaceae bacterium]